MQLEIDNIILQETSCCDNDFKCLKNGIYPLCKVEHCINTIHFVDCKSEYCDCKLNFGYGNICTYPTRKEIFNKYGK